MSSRARARLFNTQVSSSSLMSGSFTASAVSGAPPFGVMFDGTAITSSDGAILNPATGAPFGQIAQTYDFGDTSAGNHSRSGKSRNAQVCAGGVAGHVFADVGVFRVRNTCSSAGSADYSAPYIDITVLNPATVFPNTATVVVGVSNGTGRSDPSGCAYSLGAPTLASNRRYLIATGTGPFSFGSLDNLTNVRIDCIDSSGVIGRFASGTRPTITATWQVGVGGAFSDIGIGNVDVAGLVQPYAGAGFTLFNVKIRNSNNSAMLGGSDYFDQLSGVVFQSVECHGEDVTSGSGNGQYGFIGTLPKSCFNDIWVPTAYFHDIRLSHGWKTAVHHCELPGNSGSSGKHSLKINGGGGTGALLWDGSTVNHTASTGSQSGQDRWASQYISVADCILGSAGMQNDWTSECAPQAPNITEAVLDVVYERNTWYRGSSGSPNDVAAGGKRITFFKTGARANIGGNISSASLIFGTGTNSGAIPSGNDGPYLSP